MEIYKNEYRIIKVDLGIDIIEYEEIRFTVKLNKTDSDGNAILFLSYEDGDIGIYDETNGLISITIDTINMNIPIGSYYYDIQLTSTDTDEVLTATDGILIVNETVTRTAITRSNGISGSVDFVGGYGNTGGCKVEFDNAEVGNPAIYEIFLSEDQSDYYKELPVDGNSSIYNVTCSADDYTSESENLVEVTENNITTGIDFTLETKLSGASGTVDLDSTGDVQDVVITVKSGVGILGTFNPDISGDYLIWVNDGTYDLEFNLSGYATGTLSDVVFPATPGNINSGNDITLNIQDVDWIKCSGASGTYGDGSGSIELPINDDIEFYKYLKWSQDTFTAYFQETKIELSAGVPTINLNLLLDGVETNVFHYTFSSLNLTNDTEYFIYFNIVKLDDEEWKINCRIKDEHYDGLASEIQYVNGFTLAWTKSLNNSWWGYIDTGDIYVDGTLYYTPWYLHRWDISTIMGDTIPDTSYLDEADKVDLIISIDMTKIT